MPPARLNKPKPLPGIISDPLRGSYIRFMPLLQGTNRSRLQPGLIQCQYLRQPRLRFPL